MTEAPINDTNAIISLIDDAIADSLGPDWNSFQAAHHVMQWLADAGLQVVPVTRPTDAAMRKALEWIAANYENGDINHVDFRVEAKFRADDALEDSHK